MVGEELELKTDGYNLTIAANLTKTVSPVVLTYCIKKSFFIFLTQLFINLLFLYDFRKFDNF
jgi:hypothetical protein